MTLSVVTSVTDDDVFVCDVCHQASDVRGEVATLTARLAEAHERRDAAVAEQQRASDELQQHVQRANDAQDKYVNARRCPVPLLPPSTLVK